MYLVTNYNLTSHEESDNHVPRVSCDTTLLSDSLLMSSIDRLKINCHVSTTVTCPKSLVHVRIYYATPIHVSNYKDKLQEETYMAHMAKIGVDLFIRK